MRSASSGWEGKWGGGWAAKDATAVGVGGLMSDIEPGLWQLRRGIIISQVNKPSIAKTTNR